MGRCVEKCRSFAGVAAMEVTQVVGMMTRARSMALAAAEDEGLRLKRRKEDGAKAGELQTPYLRLRSRSLVMTHRLSKSVRNYERRRCRSVDRGRISRCSSISSCESVDGDSQWIPGAMVQEPSEDRGSSMRLFECSRDRRDIKPSNNQAIYPGELESTAERKSRQSTPQFTSPPTWEIEEFFAAAERSEKQRFAARYNFDVDTEVPFEGRYEWVRIIP